MKIHAAVVKISVDAARCVAHLKCFLFNENISCACAFKTSVFEASIENENKGQDVILMECVNSYKNSSHSER